MVEDSPDEYIHHLTGRNFWGDHPLGRSILGTRETLSGFGPEDIRRFFRRLYQPERIVVAAAGNLPHERFVELVGPAFAAARPGNGFPDRRPPAGRRLVSVHARDLEQVHICLATAGLSVTDPRRYALSLLNTLLGGNMSSRLFQEIREKRGLAYSVYSYHSMFAEAGMFGVYAGTTPRNAPQVLDLVRDQLEDVAVNGIRQDELTRAKGHVKGSLALSLEETSGRMMRLGRSEIGHGEILTVGQALRRVDAVTLEDTSRVAAQVLSQTRSLAVIGPFEQDAFEEAAV
jgi:predicted Zn-dependent peptidase